LDEQPDGNIPKKETGTKNPPKDESKPNNISVEISKIETEKKNKVFKTARIILIQS
jgi:hypothetical protein